MFWIILTWLTLQLILINITPSLGIQIPPSIFYLYTFFLVIPLSLIIAHIASSRSLINQKSKFANFLFGTTTILDILFMLIVPSAISNLPQVVKMETGKMLTKDIDQKTKKEFLSEMEKVSDFTVNLLYADPQLISQNQWQILSNFWDQFATALKDGKINKKEAKSLMKLYIKLFPGEVTHATKSRSHRNRHIKRRDMGKNGKTAGDKPIRRKDRKK